MFCTGKRFGLSKAVAVVFIVIVAAAAGVGAIFAPGKTTTFTQAAAPNNTIDLRANSTVELAVVASFSVTSRALTYAFIIGPLVNPTIEIKIGTHVWILFHSEVSPDPTIGSKHSFVIVNSKPPFPVFQLNQTFPPGMTPVFPGANTDNPFGIQHNPQQDQFTLSFTADKPGTYYYICGVEDHAAMGMYGQFVVEA